MRRETHFHFSVGTILLISLWSLILGLFPGEVHAQGAYCPSNMTAYWKLEEKNAQESVVLALNAGGGALTSGGITYASDSSYSPGGNVYSTTSGIAWTQDDALYQSERWGTLSYNIPIANGSYVVTLKFAEIYWTASGKRVFNVTMENREVITNLDLYSRVGKDSALDLDVPVTVADGVLNIRLTPVVDQAKLSGLVVSRVSQNAGADAVTFNDLVAANEAQCIPGGCPSPTNGKVGSGQEFIGLLTTGAFAPGDAFNWPNTQSFSIEFWMKKDLPCLGSTVNENEVIVGRDSGPPVNSPFHWWVGVNCAGTAAQQNRINFTLIDSQGNSSTLVGGKVVSDGRWHHVAVQSEYQTVQGVTKRINRIFVDGELDARTPTALESIYTGSFSSSDNPILTIGWLNLGGGFHYTGELDELAVYSGIPSTRQILADYFLVRDYCADCANPVRIMPLGDSITHGYSSGVPDNAEGLLVAYRKDLWDKLQLGGYRADFVGSLVSGYSYPGFDASHEGHSGWSAPQVAAYTFDWLSRNPPDLVLLHIGTNAVQTSTWGVDDILWEVDRYNEDIPVVLARIINRRCCLDSPPCAECATTTAFNNNLESLVNARKARGDKLFLVDMEKGAGIDYAKDMYDNLHPNASGYGKMANVWFNALSAFMPTCAGTAPVIVSSPPTSATVGTQYVYTVQAVGNPTPTYALASSPSGMTIDASTGRIAWTPSAAGSFGVTVRAANTNGTTQQSFTIVVAAPTQTTSVVHAINAGGPAFTDSSGIAYSADRNFTGGNTYSTANAIAGTADGPLYQTERWGSFSYALPVPNGTYKLTLKFAEIYWNAAGKRVFDVTVEGTRRISSLDIYAQAGANRAWDVPLDVSVTDGVLNITVQSTVDNPKLSALLVTTAAAVSPPPIHAINAGGPAFTDSSGIAYSADRNFTGGNTYSTANAIAGTSDGPLYQTERWGSFSYALPVPNGNYTLTLKFAEIYWTAPAKRVFDVTVEGTKRISSLDIYAQAGANRAYDVQIPVSVSDGVLNITVQSSVDNPKVSAVLVR